MRDRFCGVRVYAGDTQYGKSTLADVHAHQANDAGQPFLVLDRMPAKNWLGKEHARDVPDVLTRLYGQVPENVIYSPRSHDEVNRLFAHVHKAGCRGQSRTVLHDETSLDMGWNYISDEESQALRGWAHSGNLYLLTTQRFHELNAVVYVASPSVRIFHMEHEKGLERARAELNMDPARLKAFKVGECEQYGRDQ